IHHFILASHIRYISMQRQRQACSFGDWAVLQYDYFQTIEPWDLAFGIGFFQQNVNKVHQGKARWQPL
ncbi:hypothetical protein QOT17_025539, partial [Balamuthia mandrillaris]